MFDIIAKPFGVLLLWLYNLVGNYGVAIFLFALVVKIIMVPFQFKSQKGMMRMQLLNPQIQELQKRHEGNQQRLQQEISNLYREEKVNPMSGCLWMLIPYPILLALYRAVRFPLTTMMGVSAELLAEGGAIAQKLAELGFVASKANSPYLQLEQSEFISNHFAAFQGISEKLVDINYNFLGLNMTHTPTLQFWNSADWLSGNYWAAIGLFLVPIVSAGLSWLQMKIGQATNPTAGSNAQQAQQQQSMKMMNLMMPLMSLWICFSMPASMGFYWIFNSLLYIVQSLIMNRYFAKLLAEEMSVREAKQREKEAGDRAAEGRGACQGERQHQQEKAAGQAEGGAGRAQGRRHPGGKGGEAGQTRPAGETGGGHPRQPGGFPPLRQRQGLRARPLYQPRGG